MGAQGETIAAVTLGEGAVRLFSLTSRERLSAIFERLGVRELARLDACGGAQDILLVDAGFVFEERLIADFSKKRRAVLIGEDETGAQVVAAVICPAGDAPSWSERLRQKTAAALTPESYAVFRADDVCDAYNIQLRKKESPLLIKATVERRDEIEKCLFKGSYKGATDLVTKFVWPAPALYATRMCAALKLHPNVVTSVSFILVLAAIYYFLHGQFLAGLAAGWLMCFLDTVDGKLARVTMTSSGWGEVFDHGIDLIHPPFWYWAWAAGSISAGAYAAPIGAEHIWAAMWVANIGYVIGRLMEGYFLKRFKIEIHIWRPIDYWFRHITARRNPNLLLLTGAALVGAPATGLILVACWTALSLIFHGARIITAELEASEAPLRSWLAE